MFSSIVTFHRPIWVSIWEAKTTEASCMPEPGVEKKINRKLSICASDMGWSNM